MNDLRFALRQLAKSPGFTVTALLILALGIAGNTVVFSLVNGLFLKPLPFPHPERLVAIDETAPKWNLRYTGINYGDFEAWRAHNQTFAGMAHFRGGEANLAIEGRSERLSGQRVTHDLAAVVGIHPVLGRMFRADEELRNGSKVILLGHHIWKDWFAGSPAVIGTTITVDSEACEIIGVLPPTAVLPSRAAFWRPFDSKPPADSWSGLAIGRLKQGVAIEQAAADLLRIHRARIPEQKENEITSPLIQPVLQRHLGGDAVFIGVVLQCAVAVVLLIAGSNVAGLMLARTQGRVAELGLRAALGASRARLVRQLMTESLVLAVLGAAAGLLLGRWARDAVIALFPDLPAWMNLEADWRFAAFICGTVALSATLAGLIPAREVLSRLDVRNVIGAGAQQVTASRHRLRSLRVLVVGEIALALALLVVAGLLGHALLRVRQIDPGFRADHLLTYGLSLPSVKYQSNAARLAFFEQHLARLRGLPEVQAAGISTVLPFSGQHIGNFFEPEGGLPGGPGASSPVVLTRMCLPGYLDTMDIALAGGRSFTDQDRRDVVIVNETLARRFWPGASAVGRRMRARGSKGPWLEVVGVAHDVKHYGLEGEARPGVYVPFYAMPQSSVGVVVRTKGDPAALAPTIRALVKEQDATLPVTGLATMEERIRQSLFFRRMYSSLTAIFAGVAVAISTTGLYATIAYVVGQRTREFGIRLALGAQAQDLVRLLLREGLALAAVGTGMGLLGGLLAGVALRALLAGTTPFSPVVLAGVVTLVVAVVVTACLVPARRALRLNPVDVLRAE